MGRQFSKTRVNKPKLLFSVAYTALIVNGTLYRQATGVLSRDSIGRTLMFKNNTDIPLSSVTFFLEDSTFGTGSLMPSTQLVGTINAGVTDYATSEQYPELAGHVDGLSLGLQIGATAPTTGTVDIYVVEIF